MAAVDERVCCSLVCENKSTKIHDASVRMKKARNYPKEFIDPARYEFGSICSSCHMRIRRLLKVCLNLRFLKIPPDPEMCLCFDPQNKENDTNAPKNEVKQRGDGVSVRELYR